VLIVESLGLAIVFCVITMLGWGSWANTQVLTRKERWPFELFYWDYIIGVLLLGTVLMLSAGSIGTDGMRALPNLAQADASHIGYALAAGALFNVSNIMLVVAIDAAGMSVAFPVGVGLALVVGTVANYVAAPKGDPAILFSGVFLIVFAIIMSALAYRRLPRKTEKSWMRGVIFAVVAGCLMGFFYPQLVRAISPDFNVAPIEPGALTPYTALFYFGVGMLASNFIVNPIFMKAGGYTFAQYFRGSLKLHAIGMLGGIIWMLALSLNVLASGVAGPAISYALGQGATLVAAIWGVVIWKEFREAPTGTGRYIGLMFGGYVLGLVLVGAATL
jgi:glucose uptake protein